MNDNYITLKNYENAHNTLVFFRKEIENPLKSAAKIKIFASSSYQLFIDGIMIGRGTAECDSSCVYFDEYTIAVNTKFCVVVKVYSLGQNILHVPQQNQGVLALNLQIDIGGKICFSDQSFKCILAPDYYNEEIIDMQGRRVSLWGGYKEVYDDNLSLDDSFMKCGYDDLSWSNADFLKCPLEFFNKIEKRRIKMLAEYDYNNFELLQINNNLGTVTKNNDGSFIFDTSFAGSFPTIILDFKKEVVGYLTIIAQAECGSNMTVSYGECLDLVRLDSFIFGNKTGVLKPHFRKAFRYIAITFNGGNQIAVLKKVQFTMTHYPAKEIHVKFNNDLYQNVFDTSIYTSILAMQNHYEDSIYREQALWLLDARIMALNNYSFFHEYEYTDEIINKFISTQRADGSICAAGPQKTDQLLPDFCLHFIIMVEEWIRLGKGTLTDKVKNSLIKLLQWFSGNENIDGLLTVKDKPKWWCFIDWADIEKKDIVTSLNCLYYKALTAYSNIMGNDTFANKKVLSKAARLKHAINTNLQNNDGTYCDCYYNGAKSLKSSQQTNIYAILAGICDKPKVLINKIFDINYNQTKINGAFMMCLTVDMLLENDEIQLAHTIIDSYWGEMLRRGATTWWETFDMSTSRAGVPYYLSKNNATYKHEYIPVSYCHAWGAGIAHTLNKYKDKLSTR